MFIKDITLLRMKNFTMFLLLKTNDLLEVWEICFKNPVNGAHVSKDSLILLRWCDHKNIFYHATFN